MKRNIGVELCLSCNIHAKMIAGTYSDHHFGWWKDHHVPVAIGIWICFCSYSYIITDKLQTDDVGIFCCPLSEEYFLAAKHFNLTRSDIQKLRVNTVDMIFAGEGGKERLRRIYSSWNEMLKEVLLRYILGAY